MCPSIQRQTLHMFLFLTGCVCLLAACDGILPGAPNQAPTPGPSIAPIDVPHQPYRVVQYCPDTSKSVPEMVFHDSNNKVADWIDQAVQPNSEGLLLYANLITANSFAPRSTVLQITIPPLPPDPPKPVPQAMPTPTGDNVADAQARHRIEEQNTQAIQEWQQQLAKNHERLAQVRGQVRQQTDHLRGLNDPGADHTDVFGCVKRGSLRFQGINGKTLLLLATDLINTTWQEWTPDYPLPNTQVDVIFHYCSDAPTCDANDANWRQTFLHAGASVVAMYDPAESMTLPNPFTH